MKVINKLVCLSSNQIPISLTFKVYLNENKMEDWLTYPGSTLLEGNENEDNNNDSKFAMRENGKA